MCVVNVLECNGWVCICLFVEIFVFESEIGDDVILVDCFVDVGDDVLFGEFLYIIGDYVGVNFEIVFVV